MGSTIRIPCTIDVTWMTSAENSDKSACSSFYMCIISTFGSELMYVLRVHLVQGGVEA